MLEVSRWTTNPVRANSPFLSAFSGELVCALCSPTAYLSAHWGPGVPTDTTLHAVFRWVGALSQLKPFRAQITSNNHNNQWLSPLILTLSKTPRAALSRLTLYWLQFRRADAGDKIIIGTFFGTKVPLWGFLSRYWQADPGQLGSYGSITAHSDLAGGKQNESLGLSPVVSRRCSQQLLLISLPLSFIPLLQCKINTFRSEIMRCLACILEILF